METVKKNVGVLAVCQGLLLANKSALVTVNALAGYALATDKSLATLPVTAYFVGSMLTTLPLSLLMKRYGRRAGFTLGSAAAAAFAAGCGLGQIGGSPSAGAGHFVYNSTKRQGGLGTVSLPLFLKDNSAFPERSI